MNYLPETPAETPSAEPSPLNHRVRLLKGLWKLRCIEDSENMELRSAAGATRHDSLSEGGEPHDL